MSSLVHSGQEAVVPTAQVEKSSFQVKDFRAELTKVMPGYEWTVHRQHKQYPDYFEATGIQSSGFNRLSTLSVIRRQRAGQTEYEVKSAGFGGRAPWLATYKDGTLARALRSLQQYYETTAATYRGHAVALQSARPAKATGEAA